MEEVRKECHGERREKEENCLHCHVCSPEEQSVLIHDVVDWIRHQGGPYRFISLRGHRRPALHQIRRSRSVVEKSVNDDRLRQR